MKTWTNELRNTLYQAAMQRDSVRPHLEDEHLPVNPKIAAYALAVHAQRNSLRRHARTIAAWSYVCNDPPARMRHPHLQSTWAGKCHSDNMVGSNAYQMQEMETWW